MVNPVAVFAGSGLLSYLLGAIPTGYLIARARGVDIRKVGSGNTGATNVFRAVGKTWGILTFLGDFLKGFAPALFMPIMARHWFGCEGGQPLALLCAGLAIAGHNWPVYLRFKGGKGVATSAGGLLGFAPVPLLVGLGIWILVFLTTRYVSVASLSVAVAVPAVTWFLYASEGVLLPAVLSLLGLLIAIRHRSNIRRLLEGREHRFEFRKRPKETSPTCGEQE